MRAKANYATISNMKFQAILRLDQDQRGTLNALLIPLILAVLFFGGAVAFGVWAFNGRQDYKNNVDQKVSAANAVTKQQTQAADAQTYAQEAKKPLKTYVGPASFGSVTVQYPKTWSAYVVENSTSSTPINGYFQPDFVPDVSSATNSFWLRVQLNQTPYNTVMGGFSGNVQAGTVTVAPYSLPKVPSVVGSIVTGQINADGNKPGTMIVLPLRSSTLEIWTESSSALPDFNSNILPNLSFSP